MAVKSKGFLTSITKLFNGKYQVVFEMEKPLDHKSDELLNIEVKKYRKGRSLNANSYFHLLCDKIAKERNITSTASKNILLGFYGTIDEEVNAILMLDNIEYLEMDNLHLKPTSRTEAFESGKLYRVYHVIKPTHLYDTKEMASLIDGTINDCKELGIDTLTPTEIERMKGAWLG
ncbi:MAG TPA: hypothetical protein VJ083_03675 [Sedimentibacter sp.]|nr:hypothetical protein [Sedimentibacter sp.]